MNAVRRKCLRAVLDELEALRGDLEGLLEEEQDYLDNMPENFQGSEKYEIAENAISAMEDALSSLEEAADNIEAATE